VGRVWPRHRHRGRPLNSVVSHHLNSVDIATIFQIVEIGFAIAVFLGLLFGGATSKFTPRNAAWSGLALIGIGLSVQLMGAAIRVHEWRGLVPWLSMQRDTIWHGTTFLAIAYGVLGYSGLSALMRRGPKEGDG
jgi:hypothetical protein